MITLVQRVTRAHVRVAEEVVGQIERGLLLFVGVQRGDSEADADTTARKVASFRIFPGRSPLDRTVKEVAGSCLVVSQFTLAATLHRGNRPGFDQAESPELAKGLYERVVRQLATDGIPVATGRFGADMQVELVNDGPVTFVLRCRNGVVAKPETWQVDEGQE